MLSFRILGIFCDHHPSSDGIAILQCPCYIQARCFLLHLSHAGLRVFASPISLFSCVAYYPPPNHAPSRSGTLGRKPRRISLDGTTDSIYSLVYSRHPPAQHRSIPSFYHTCLVPDCPHPLCAHISLGYNEGIRSCPQGVNQRSTCNMGSCSRDARRGQHPLVGHSKRADLLGGGCLGQYQTRSTSVRYGFAVPSFSPFLFYPMTLVGPQDMPFLHQRTPVGGRRLWEGTSWTFTQIPHISCNTSSHSTAWTWPRSCLSGYSSCTIR